MFSMYVLDVYLLSDDLGNIPLAIPNSPAVSSARVASLGKFSSTTEAAIVMGRAASWSCSASGEGGDGDGDGDGEGMVDAVVIFLFRSCGDMASLALGACTRDLLY